MRVCIRCNPVSILLKDENGEEYCYLHGKEFIAEDQPDPVVEQEVIEGVGDERHES